MEYEVEGSRSKDTPKQPGDTHILSNEACKNGENLAIHPSPNVLRKHADEKPRWVELANPRLPR